MPIRRAALRLALGLFAPFACWAQPSPETAPEAYRQIGKFPEELRDSDGDGVPDIDDNCPDTRAEQLAPREGRPPLVDACGCVVDPCDCDADSDGVGDCRDACPGTYPGHVVQEDGCPQPIVEGVRVLLDVKFEFDKADILPGLEKDLLTLREALVQYPELRVVLEGHTDWKGSQSYNQKLSERRAGACRTFILRDTRIAPERVTAVGHGELQPIADNDTEAGRAKNRRTVAELVTEKVIVPANDQPPPLRGLAPETGAPPGQAP